MMGAAALVDGQSTQETPRTRPNERLYELDLARFVAAMGVVAFHYLYLGPVLEVTENPPGPLSQIARFGFLGVDFFFILSGFVIMMSATNRNASSFVRARIVRLYPAFWICVLITAGVRSFESDITLTRVLANLTMFPNRLGESGLDGAYWSLAVEAQFYALVAIAIRFGLLAHLDAVLLGWISYCILTVATDTPEVIDEILMTAYAHYFVAGAVFYQLHRDRTITAVRVATLMAAVLLALSWIGPRVNHLEEKSGYTLSVTVSRLILLSFFAIVAVVAWHGLPTLRVPKFAALGAASYPLYLLHQEIGFAVFRTLGWSLVPMAVITVGAMTAAAHLIARHVEPRLGSVLGRIVRHNRSRLPAS